MKFLYSVVTTDGRKFKVEAESAERALELIHLAEKDCKKWFPFPIKKVLSEEERKALREKLERLKANPKYRENSMAKKRVKKRSGIR